MAGNNVDVELWNLRVPLVPPIHSPKEMVTETCLLLVFASDKNGNRGIGYSSFRRSSDMDLASTIASKLVAESAPGLAGLLDIERQEEATCESNAASRCAANAISLAAWDLAGKQAGVPCADLWGRPAGRDSLECYASALWLDKSPAELIAEAKMHRRNNYRYVKMRSVVHLRTTWNGSRPSAKCIPSPEPSRSKRALIGRQRSPTSFSMRAAQSSCGSRIPKHTTRYISSGTTRSIPSRLERNPPLRASSTTCIHAAGFAS